MSYVHRATASILAVAFMSLCLLVSSASATQIAQYFIHGKGNAGLADRNNALGYWDHGNFMSLASGFGVPYEYSAVDGTQSLDTAAFGMYDCLGGNCGDPDTRYNNPFRGRRGVMSQMADFIKAWNATHLVVVTHSMGGNVIRNILGNTHYFDWCADKYKPADYDLLCVRLKAEQDLVILRTKTVHAIAAPFLGSEAADLSKTLSGSWLTGWIADWINKTDAATRDCTTVRMTYLNSHTLWGTYGRQWPGPYYQRWVWHASGMTAVGQWNDRVHLEDTELVGAAAVIPFAGGMSDGLVSYQSQTALQYINTGDQHRYNNNHFHSKYGSSGVWCDPYPGTCYGLKYGADTAMVIHDAVAGLQWSLCGIPSWQSGGWCIP